MEGSPLRAAFVTAVLLSGLLVRTETQPRGVDARSVQAHACTFDHQTLWTPASSCRPRAKSYPPKVVGFVRHAIYDTALMFGMPYSVLLKIAKCESGLNTRAVNGPYRGLFQFLPATFHSATRGLKTETGVVARSVWNARDSSYAAGYLFATGMSRSWTCEKPITPR